MSEHQKMQQPGKPDSTFQKQAALASQNPVSHPASIIQHARIDPKSLTTADVLQLQRTIGNRAVGRLLSEIRNTSKVQEAAIQRQEVPEEEKEPLQGMFGKEPEEETCPSCMQRQEISEDDEPVQGKMIGTIQRQEIQDEEELQMKSVVQRQKISEEKDEPVQRKMIETVQRQEIPEEEPLRKKSENNTGMPDNLKTGVENLSGIDMSDVRVHFNSEKPAKVGALAYTQGTNIHVAPGQERHLPHEAWHVVQQAQGRVRPTVQLKDGVPINDEQGLEREADVMGAKASQVSTPMVQDPTPSKDLLQPFEEATSQPLESKEGGGQGLNINAIQKKGTRHDTGCGCTMCLDTGQKIQLKPNEPGIISEGNSLQGTKGHEAAKTGTAHHQTLGAMPPVSSPKPEVPLAEYIQMVPIDGLSERKKEELVTAYRTDSSNGLMWGRESDLNALARNLVLNIHVLDFSEDPSAFKTGQVHLYDGGGRNIYLRYTGNHYDVLEPSPKGLFRSGVQRFRSYPIPGDGNCLFASVWQAAKQEVNAAKMVIEPQHPLINDLNEGQGFLRRYCHSIVTPAVKDEQILNEIRAMGHDLSDEHIGPRLSDLLGPIVADLDQSQPKDKRKSKDKVEGMFRPPSAVAVKGASVLSPEMARARLSKFKNAPDYWANLDWTSISDYVMKAVLPKGDMFTHIQESVSAGIESQPYVSSKGESTRMDVVTKRIRELKEKQKTGNLLPDEISSLPVLERRLTEKDRGGPAPPRSHPVEIERIEVIANQKLWNAYQAAANAIRGDLDTRGDKEPLKKVKFKGSKFQSLDAEVGEKRLFHAASPAIFDMIEKGGFNPAYSANKAKPGEKPRYGPLGQGSYFADVMSKAMTYTRCPVCSDYDCQVHTDQAAQILLARVLLGHTKKAHSFLQPGTLRGEDLSTMKEGRHSAYSEGIKGSKNPFTAASGLNEYAVREAAQAYPEFRIYYKIKRL